MGGGVKRCVVQNSAALWLIFDAIDVYEVIVGVSFLELFNPKACVEGVNKKSAASMLGKSLKMRRR